MTCQEAALQYLSYGWSVIPVGPDKRPLIPWEPYQHRLATEEEIKSWYKKFPKAGVGVVCGKISGLVVLDIDPRHGGDQTLLDWAGKGLQIPLTATAKTPSGGCHFYFNHPGGEIPTMLNFAPGADLKAEGSYVVAPPTIHESGNIYQFNPGEEPNDFS